MPSASTPGLPGLVEVLWSPTAPDAPPDCRTSATSHGDFDNDPDTMDSVARRILRRTDIVEFPSPGRRRSARRTDAAFDLPADAGSATLLGRPR